MPRYLLSETALAAGWFTQVVMAIVFIRWDTVGLRWRKLSLALRLQLLCPLFGSAIVLLALIALGFWLGSIARLPVTSLPSRDAIGLGCVLAPMGAFGLYLLADKIIRRVFRLRLDRPQGGSGPSIYGPYRPW